MVELGRDSQAPGPSDRDLTEDGTGRLGLAFNRTIPIYKEFRWTPLLRPYLVRAVRRLYGLFRSPTSKTQPATLRRTAPRTVQWAKYK